MAGHITITAAHDGSLDNPTVREALSDLDPSESSPVGAAAREAGTTLGDETLAVTIDGHDGDFTKTSQDALVAALKTIPAVDADAVTVADGGYSDE